MNHPTEINKAHAQLLMSQLLDGELASTDAELLQTYLETHPEEADWMETADTLRSVNQPDPVSHQREASIAAIRKAVSPQKQAASPRSKLLSFPSLFRPLAAAAAVAIIGTVTWLGLNPTPSPEFEMNIVEFVATDIPDASIYINSDEEIGWTVVWIDTDDRVKDATKG